MAMNWSLPMEISLPRPWRGAWFGAMEIWFLNFWKRF